MRTRTLPAITLSFLLTASLGLWGCDKGGDTTPPEDGGDVAAEGGGDGGDAAGGDDGAADPEPEAPKTWADMDRNARMELMGTKVLPAMKSAFEAQGFKEFKCANCHGEDMKDVDFKMPNDLTDLDPENPIQSSLACAGSTPSPPSRDVPGRRPAIRRSGSCLTPTRGSATPSPAPSTGAAATRPACRFSVRTARPG